MMKNSNTQIFLIELNEINFDFVEKYIEQGKLPNFAKLIKQHGVVKTVSEDEYENLEPWVQWVTAHTGLSYSEHGVYRLGDITKRNIPQIWEFLEKKGLKVGAISPMNANNFLENGCFFVPDPWTNTPCGGSFLLRKLSASISQAVNDNAQSKIDSQSIAWLMIGALRYSRFVNYIDYARLVIAAVKKKSWAKAQFLDLLLTDVMISESLSKKTNFVSLFLNAGAHIQHHYMFNSSVYEGIQRNPEWLISPKEDPTLDIFSQYDKSIGQLINTFPKARFIIATGLHQEPYGEEKYYWRLKDHDSFLQKIGLMFKSVEPLMSRDFIIECHSEDEASEAQKILEGITSRDGITIFSVDNRGSSLFVMLVYPSEINAAFELRIGGEMYPDFINSVSFVAIKNGEHDGIGYLIDTGAAEPHADSIQLTELPKLVSAGFGHSWGR